MKKSIFLCSLFLTGIIGYAQNTFPTATNTNVGIGTTSPSTRLQITSATAGTSGVRLTNLTSSTTASTGNSKGLSVDSSGNIILTPMSNTDIYSADGTLTSTRNVTMNAKNLTFTPTTSNSQFFINGTNGNVGVGSINPTGRLDIGGGPASIASFGTLNDKFEKSLVLNAGSLVNGSTKYRNLRLFDFPQSNFDALPSIFLGIEDRNDFGRYRFVAETGGATHLIVLDKTQTEVFKVYDDGSNNTVVTLPKANSYLCIGGINPVDGADVYKLSVKGKVRAEEVKVYTSWADYVFNKDYNLKSLNEVEEFINENGHLPNMPAGSTIEKEGLKLGEMAKNQQEKIEELTLYIIDLNKKLEAQQKQIDTLLKSK